MEIRRHSSSKTFQTNVHSYPRLNLHGLYSGRPNIRLFCPGLEQANCQLETSEKALAFIFDSSPFDPHKPESKPTNQKKPTWLPYCKHGLKRFVRMKKSAGYLVFLWRWFDLALVRIGVRSQVRRNAHHSGVSYCRCLTRSWRCTGQQQSL